jgi:hypothetical protein
VSDDRKVIKTEMTTEGAPNGCLVNLWSIEMLAVMPSGSYFYM